MRTTGFLSVEVREFALVVLAGNGNHPNADPYLKYFPQGYGEAMQLTAAALGTFGRQILTTLAEETGPKSWPTAGPVEEALNRFLASEDAWQTAHRNRLEAFAAVQSEKRNWVRGVQKARALAESACHYERAYTRSIFAPVRAPRRAPEEAEAGETLAPVAAGNAGTRPCAGARPRVARSRASSG